MMRMTGWTRLTMLTSDEEEEVDQVDEVDQDDKVDENDEVEVDEVDEIDWMAKMTRSMRLTRMKRVASMMRLKRSTRTRSTRACVLLRVIKGFRESCKGGAGIRSQDPGNRPGGVYYTSRRSMSSMQDASDIWEGPSSRDRPAKGYCKIGEEDKRSRAGWMEQEKCRSFTIKVLFINMNSGISQRHEKDLSKPDCRREAHQPDYLTFGYGKKKKKKRQKFHHKGYLH
jgi:hypothetical protein